MGEIVHCHSREPHVAMKPLQTIFMRRWPCLMASIPMAWHHRYDLTRHDKPRNRLIQGVDDTRRQLFGLTQSFRGLYFGLFLGTSQVTMLRNGVGTNAIHNQTPRGDLRNSNNALLTKCGCNYKKISIQPNWVQYTSANQFSLQA